ncbi:MAG: hypothetical protein ACM3QU_03640 [Verrucomicrobiota bacterium]
MARARKAASAQAKARPRSDFEDRPELRKLTARQAAYLEEISGVPAEKLVAKPLGELDSLLRWRVDPDLLLFRKVCGRVVRVEPGTGIIQGVPNATVHVQDTDCSFLGFFPVEGPFSWWWWFWPIFCHSEEIASTITDECGRFCVWIPRWDIDRILRFRLERVCYPYFVKPTLGDVLREIGPGPVERPPIKVNPNPPDPAPFEVPERGVLEQAGALLGRSLDRVVQFADRRTFGEDTGDLRALFEEPAFLGGFRPPLTREALERVEELSIPEHRERGTKAQRFELAELTPAKAIGPFLRCRDVLVAEWEYIVDVPDITFRVTQDVDLDGDEETIYSEGFFDVRWNAGTIPPVTLKASPIARPSPICEGPVIPCGNKPEIVTVGLMPLASTHHNNATGCATRVNRPKPGGLFGDPPTPGTGTPTAESPYGGTLQLHGCHRIGGAKYYRLLYKYEGGPELPFLGLDFYPPRLTGPPWWTPAVPDSQGWYEVLDPASDYVFPNWLVDWRTWNGSFPNGNYEIRLQLADGSKTPLSPPAEFSDPVTIRVDNSAPSASFDQVRWRVVGGPWVETFTWPFACIVIHRPKNKDIEIEVSWSAAATQFRSARIYAYGCGAGDPGLSSGIASAEHWHGDVLLDNSMSRATLWSVPHTLPQGSYGFTIHSSSRAFNPAGDGGGPGINWLTDYDYLYITPSIGIAVIDS